MKQRIIAAIAGLAALFGLSSCLEVDQSITIKKNGSGTITEEVVLGAQMVAMMEGGLGGPGGENPLKDMYDEQKYKDKAAGYGTGVKFVKLEKIERNGGKGVKVHYAFEDVNRVQFSPGSAMDDFQKGAPGAEGGEDKEEPIRFVYEGGALTIVFPDIKGGEGAGEVGEEAPVDPAQEAMMAQMFRDMKIAAKVNIDAGIKKTDATYVDGKTITLMEMNFGEIIKNPGGIKALQKMDKGTRAEMSKALKGIKGVKIEMKEKVEVKMN